MSRYEDALSSSKNLTFTPLMADRYVHSYLARIGEASNLAQVECLSTTEAVLWLVCGKETSWLGAWAAGLVKEAATTHVTCRWQHRMCWLYSGLELVLVVWTVQCFFTECARIISGFCGNSFVVIDLGSKTKHLRFHMCLEGPRALRNNQSLGLRPQSETTHDTHF